MIRILSLVITVLLVALTVHAEVDIQKEKITLKPLLAPISFGLDNQGQPALLIYREGIGYQQTDWTIVDHLLDEAYQQARRYACDKKFSPASVTASVGVIAITWELNALCGTADSKK